MIRGEVGAGDVYLGVSSLHLPAKIQSTILGILTCFHRQQGLMIAFWSFTERFFLVCQSFMSTPCWSGRLWGGGSGTSVFPDRKSPLVKSLLRGLTVVCSASTTLCRERFNSSPCSSPGGQRPPLSCWPTNSQVQHTASCGNPEWVTPRWASVV